jgi:hypothetical protein
MYWTCYRSCTDIFQRSSQQQGCSLHPLVQPSAATRSSIQLTQLRSSLGVCLHSRGNTRTHQRTLQSLWMSLVQHSGVLVSFACPAAAFMQGALRMPQPVVYNEQLPHDRPAAAGAPPLCLQHTATTCKLHVHGFGGCSATRIRCESHWHVSVYPQVDAEHRLTLLPGTACTPSTRHTGRLTRQP